MQRIASGFLVVGINDRHLGTVVELNGCCYTVALAEGSERVRLTQESIFNVDAGRVTLVCMVDEVSRYQCVVHSHRSFG